MCPILYPSSALPLNSEEWILYRQAVANYEHDVEEPLVARREFHEEQIFGHSFHFEADVRIGTHHAETFEPVFAIWNRMCQFNAEPVAIRERQVLSDSEVLLPAALKGEHLFESIFVKAAARHSRPTTMLIHEFVSCNKVLNKKI